MSAVINLWASLTFNRRSMWRWELYKYMIMWFGKTTLPNWLPEVTLNSNWSFPMKLKYWSKITETENLWMTILESLVPKFTLQGSGILQRSISKFLWWCIILCLIRHLRHHLAMWCNTSRHVTSQYFDTTEWIQNLVSLHLAIGLWKARQHLFTSPIWISYF
jgi:hypothetical protein